MVLTDLRPAVCWSGRSRDEAKMSSGQLVLTEHRLNAVVCGGPSVGGGPPAAEGLMENISGPFVVVCWDLLSIIPRLVG